MKQSAEEIKMCSGAAMWIESVLSPMQENSRSHSALTSLLRCANSNKDNDRSSDKTTIVINMANNLINRAFSSAVLQKFQALSLFKLTLHRVVLLALEEITSVNAFDAINPSLCRLTVTSLVESEPEMLAGLVQACCELVLLACCSIETDNETVAFPSLSERMGRTTQWLEMLHAISWIRLCTTRNFIGTSRAEGEFSAFPKFPKDLADSIDSIEIKITELLMFVPRSSFFHRIARYSGDIEGQLQHSNQVLLETTIRKVIASAKLRALHIIQELYRTGSVSKLSRCSMVKIALKEAVCEAIHRILHDHLSILNNRNSGVFVIGIIYSTAKSCGIDMRFKALLKAGEACIPYYNADSTFVNVSLSPAVITVDDDKSDAESRWKKSDEDAERKMNCRIGSAREFYNLVLVPLIQQYVERDEGIAALVGEHAAKALMEAIGGVSKNCMSNDSKQLGGIGDCTTTRSKAKKPSNLFANRSL